MTIRRSATTGDRVTVLRTVTLQDQRLSWLARGVLAGVLSRPMDWKTSAERIAAESPGEGRDAIRRALRELESAGYLRRTVVRNADGRIRTEWDISDEPVHHDDASVKTQVRDIPAGHTEDGLPAVGQPAVGQPVLLQDLETGSRDRTPYPPVASTPSSLMDLPCSSVEVSPGASHGSGCGREEPEDRNPDPEPVDPPVDPPAAPEPPVRPCAPPCAPVARQATHPPADGPGTRETRRSAPEKNYQAVRKALTRVNAEHPFPLGYEEILHELERIGRGDPWAGFLAAKPAWQRPLTDDVRDPAAALRARLRNTPLVPAGQPRRDQTPADHATGPVIRGSQGGWAKCREQLRAARDARREAREPVPA